jgi:hypothetical protein
MATLPQRPAVRGSEELEACGAELILEWKESQTPEVHTKGLRVHGRFARMGEEPVRVGPR